MNKNIYKINIFKLDHRPFRDKRITTHCALVSRAFLANSFYYSGIKDDKIENNIKSINKRWGSDFEINYIKDPKTFIKDFKKNKGFIIHLTMYGEKIEKTIKTIQNKLTKQNILIILGGPKVETFYYENADYNISVTNQPHSEIAALSLILYLIDPKLLKHEFKDSKIKINPNKHKKDVINL